MTKLAAAKSKNQAAIFFSKIKTVGQASCLSWTGWKPVPLCLTLRAREKNLFEIGAVISN
jgi:hypothetical protein